MVRFQNVLGEMAVSMVRAGSEGGFLEEALTRVAQFTEGQDDLKKRTMWRSWPIQCSWPWWARSS